MRRIVAVVAVLVGVGVGCSNVSVTRARGVPWMPPSAHVDVQKSPANPAAVELARIQVRGSEGSECEGQLRVEAQRLGADVVVLNVDSLVPCSGIAYKSPQTQPSK